MKGNEKMIANERQNLIVNTLKKTDKPITGSEFAKITNVSRQVIVQDVSILKAKNEPIIATSQGYIYLNDEKEHQLERMVIVCNHTPDQALDEMYAIVDHGVSIKDVIVEHQVYGDLTASIRVRTRKEVDDFIQKISETNASYLSTLTNGIHLHTIESDSRDKLEAVCEELRKAGILV
ncbi:transcription repressor NadR [Oceanobacillus bengalensis]|uniref:Transcription repressor NadR n=1 Tax=Oceanobacillus bengalensis TaxID=1435466 RepID=A0A494YS18_9BACI|nr:transcription repressor NadR [Oceanobacillus bengalensis]RKQ12450.1 transcription repressor NadR [Oceanobacillus bengalensis]